MSVGSGPAAVQERHITGLYGCLSAPLTPGDVCRNP